MASPCVQCGQPSDDGPICGWDCHVAHARAAGARELLPNGLPPQCIRHDNVLLECEHGDHESYLFPVEITGEESSAAPELREYPQVHALIYTDGQLALTLYEGCYEMWFVRDGRPLGGRGQAQHERLTEGARAAIRAHHAKRATRAPGG